MKSGVATGVHYPTPIHRQPAYAELAVEGGFPVAERLAGRVVSLPLSPDHTDEEIDRGRAGRNGLADLPTEVVNG